MQIDPTWNLAIALVLLTGGAALAAHLGRLRVTGQVVVAAVRAALQLAVVSTIIVAAIHQLWSSTLFVVAMFAIGVFTTVRRVGIRSAWPWTALAMASGVVPVLAAIYFTGTTPLNGYSLIPIGSIIVGNVMTAHTLVGRRVFAALRDNIGVYDAVLAVGLPRRRAIWMVVQPVAAEALVPNLDSTRTVGLVTLPGAFIGVLLGGGTAIQAGASQLLVLIGIMTGQTLTVLVANYLICRAKLLPGDLHTRLRP